MSLAHSLLLSLRTKVLTLEECAAQLNNFETTVDVTTSLCLFVESPVESVYSRKATFKQSMWSTVWEWSYQLTQIHRRKGEYTQYKWLTGADGLKCCQTRFLLLDDVSSCTVETLHNTLVARLTRFIQWVVSSGWNIRGFFFHDLYCIVKTVSSLLYVYQNNQQQNGLLKVPTLQIPKYFH